MLEDLEGYLYASATAQMRTLIMDCCATLANAGVQKHQYMLSNAMDAAEGQDTDVIFEGIVGSLVPVFRETLKEFGIAVTKDITLHQINSILKGVLLLDDWDDKQMLNSLCDNVDGNEAALADMLEIVSDLSSGEYMTVILGVSEGLIARISDLTATSDDSGDQPDPILVAAAQTRLRALLPHAGFDDSSVFIRALDAHMRLGISFELLIGPWMQELLALPVKRIAPELVAFAYASSLSNETILPLLNKLKENYELSVPDMMLVDRDIKKLLGV